MDPLHQAVLLGQIILLFVPALGIVNVAVVTIARNQDWKIVGEATAEADFVGAPDLIDALQQVLRHVVCTV